MNARIPVEHKITRKQKDFVKEYLESQELSRTRKTYKLVCVSLHELYGFGVNRLIKLIGKIDELSAEHENDEIFWHHVDRVVIDELGIKFERERD